MRSALATVPGSAEFVGHVADETSVLAVVVKCAASRLLHCCLDALAAHERRPDEVLVVDNAGIPAVTLGDAAVRVRRTVANGGPAGGLATAVELFLRRLLDALSARQPGDATGDLGLTMPCSSPGRPKADELPTHNPAAEEAARVRGLVEWGESLRRAGCWPQAEAVQREALAAAERVHGDGSLEVAVAAHGLAVTCKYSGRFDDAEDLYRRALAVAIDRDELAFGAVICHNIGGLAHARGDYANGEPWARRSIELRRRSHGSLVDIAADQGALAALLLSGGQLDEAEATFLEARAAFAAELGASHYEVGVIDGNLAALALERNDLTAAEERARQAVAVKEAALGQNNPELAPTLTTLGTIRRQQGDPIEAAALHRRALTVLEPAVTPEHPLLDTIRANLEAATADLARRQRAPGPSTGSVHLTRLRTAART